MRFKRLLAAALGLVVLAPAGGVMAQPGPGRIDPRIVTPDLVAPVAPARQRAAARIDAPASAPAVETTSSGVVMGAIRVEGATELTAADFAPAFTPWLGRALSPAELGALATAIADVARSRGYVFARASVPAQAVASGVLTVRIDEGRIDAVRIDGDRGGAVAAVFAPLANGRPVTRIGLETRIMLAGDVPGVRIGAVTLRHDGARNVLVVPVTYDRVWGRAGFDNRGTRLIGPERLRGEIDIAGLALARDLLTIEAAITPIDNREFRLIGGRYAVMTGQSGTVLALSGYYARTHAGGAYRQLGIAGTNYEGALRISQPLVRLKRSAAWIEGGLAVRRSLQDVDALRIREDKVTAATLGLRGQTPVAGGLARGEIGITAGLGLFDATRSGNVLASRAGGSGRFVAWTADAVWIRPIDPRWTLRLTGAAQLANRALLAGEQFSLGGARFLRGYDYGERLGDEGAAGSAELSFSLPKAPGPLKRPELYAFVDGGAVSSKQGGHQSLASAGGGVRAGIGPSLAVGVEAAAPLTGPRYETGKRSPRFSFSVSALF